MRLYTGHPLIRTLGTKVIQSKSEAADDWRAAVISEVLGEFLMRRRIHFYRNVSKLL